MKAPKATAREPYVLKHKTKTVKSEGKIYPVFILASENVIKSMTGPNKENWVIVESPSKKAPKKVISPPEVEAKK